MTEPDIELLADYAEGLLDGTPEGEAVAARIVTDPAWADLYAALAGADDAVRRDLAALPPEQIPADVARSVDATLAAEAGRYRPQPGAVPSAGPARPVRPATRQPHAAGGTVVPMRRRRRTLAYVGSGVAAGVAVLAAAAIGFSAITSNGGVTSSPNGAAAPDRDLATGSPAPGGTPGGLTSASGTDYRTAKLAPQVQALLSGKSATKLSPDRHAPEASTPSPKGAAPAPAEPSSAVPPELSRLATPAGLNACLATLGQDAGRPIATDLARYNGAPALVVVLHSADPAKVTVVVTGPSCGLSGSDELFRTTVPR